MDPDRVFLLAKLGNKEAREELAKKVIEIIPIKLRTKFRKIEPRDIDDAIQYTLMKFFENPMAVKASTMGVFLSWAFSVGKNYILNQFNAAERKYCDSFYTVDENGIEIEIPIMGIDGEEAFLKAEMSKRSAFLLSLAMATLNSEDYKLIGDFYYKNVSLEAIAADLNVSIDAVKKRKQRTLLKLKGMLEALGLSQEDL